MTDQPKRAIIVVMNGIVEIVAQDEDMELLVMDYDIELEREGDEAGFFLDPEGELCSAIIYDEPINLAQLEPMFETVFDWNLSTREAVYDYP